MTAPSPYSMLDTEKKCSMSLHHCSMFLIQLLQHWKGGGGVNWLIYSILLKIYIYLKCPTFSCHWLSELKEGSFVSNGTTIKIIVLETVKFFGD